MHVCYVCTCVWACMHKGQRNPALPFPGLLLWDKVSQYLDWQSASLHHPPASGPYHTEITATCAATHGFLHLCWDLKTRSHPWTASTLTHRAISPTPTSTHILKWGKNGTEPHVHRGQRHSQSSHLIITKSALKTHGEILPRVPRVGPSRRPPPKQRRLILHTKGDSRMENKTSVSFLTLLISCSISQWVTAAETLALLSAGCSCKSQLKLFNRRPGWPTLDTTQWILISFVLCKKCLRKWNLTTQVS